MKEIQIYCVKLIFLHEMRLQSIVEQATGHLVVARMPENKLQMMSIERINDDNADTRKIFMHCKQTLDTLSNPEAAVIA